MSTLQFRNIDATPEAPVTEWGFEGILTALERGNVGHWRKIAARIAAEPYGDFADTVSQAVSICSDSGVASLMRTILEHHQRLAQDVAREEVASRLRAARDRSGLTTEQFARRLGTSRTRMSTYLSGKVTPSAALLVRAEARHIS
ncbi:MAG: helix-turn-helix domain-containing protein [Nocardioides sp.]